jgi:hypothetical protein
MRSVRAAFGFLLLGAAAAQAQYLISTYAGGAPPPTPAVGVEMPIGQPFGIAADAAGNAYFTTFDCIFKLDLNGGRAA